MLFQPFSNLLLRANVLRVIHSRISLGALGTRCTVRRRCCADASTASRVSYRLGDGRLRSGPLRYDRELNVIVRRRGLRRLTPDPSRDNAGDAKGNEDKQTHCENYDPCPLLLLLLSLSLGVARGTGNVAVKSTIDWSHCEKCMCVLTGIEVGRVALCNQLLDRGVRGEE